MDITDLLIESLAMQDVKIEKQKCCRKTRKLELWIRQNREDACCYQCGGPLYGVHSWRQKVLKGPPVGAFNQYINLAAAIVFFGTVGYQLHTELYPIDAMFAGTDPYLETLVASAQAEHFTRYGREMTEREIEIFKGSFRALRAIDLKEMAIRHTPQEAN
jgi:hypothetical protein